jgi:hypothetical protein
MWVGNDDIIAINRFTEQKHVKRNPHSMKCPLQQRKVRFVAKEHHDSDKTVPSSLPSQQDGVEEEEH